MKTHNELFKSILSNNLTVLKGSKNEFELYEEIQLVNPLRFEYKFDRKGIIEKAFIQHNVF
jgi:hypothetical protein